MAIEAHKQKLIERKLRAEKRRERKMQAEILAQRLAETKLQRRLEQQGLSSVWFGLKFVVGGLNSTSKGNYCILEPSMNNFR